MTVADRLAEIVSMQLGIDRDRVTRDASFAGDLGADSLDAVELVMKCEDWFDISIPDKDVERLRTVGDAVAYVEKHLKEQASASTNGPRVGAMPKKPQPPPKPQSVQPAVTGRAAVKRFLKRFFLWILIWQTLIVSLFAGVEPCLLTNGSRLPNEAAIAVGMLGIQLMFWVFIIECATMRPVVDALPQAEWRRRAGSVRRWVGVGAILLFLMQIPYLYWADQCSNATVITQAQQWVLKEQSLIWTSIGFLSFFLPLRLGQLCGWLGEEYGAPKLKGRAERLTRSWKIALAEVYTLAAIAAIVAHFRETFVIGVLLAMLMTFLLYCFTNLLIVLAMATNAAALGPIRSMPQSS